MSARSPDYCLVVLRQLINSPHFSLRHSIRDRSKECHNAESISVRCRYSRCSPDNARYLRRSRRRSFARSFRIAGDGSWEAIRASL